MNTFCLQNSCNDRVDCNQLHSDSWLYQQIGINQDQRNQVYIQEMLNNTELEMKRMFGYGNMISGVLDNNAGCTEIIQKYIGKCIDECVTKSVDDLNNIMQNVINDVKNKIYNKFNKYIKSIDFGQLASLDTIKDRFRNILNENIQEEMINQFKLYDEIRKIEQDLKQIVNKIESRWQQMSVDLQNIIDKYSSEFRSIDRSYFKYSRQEQIKLSQCKNIIKLKDSQDIFQNQSKINKYLDQNTDFKIVLYLNHKTISRLKFINQNLKYNKCQDRLYKMNVELSDENIEEVVHIMEMISLNFRNIISITINSKDSISLQDHAQMAEQINKFNIYDFQLLLQVHPQQGIPILEVYKENINQNNCLEQFLYSFEKKGVTKILQLDYQVNKSCDQFFNLIENIDCDI